MSVRASRHRVARVRDWLGVQVAVGVLLAIAVGAGLVVVLDGDELIVGLPVPGLLTRVGLPVMWVLSECAAVVTVGSLLLAAFLVPPQASGQLDTGGYAALRTARIVAFIWALTAALMVPLSAADAVGRLVTDVLDPQLLASLVSQLSEPGAWALTAWIVLVLAGFCWIALTWGAAVWLCALSVVGLMPVALTGHSSAGGAHDIAASSLLYYVVAAALWVGGLIALLAYLAHRGDHAGLATQRFSRLALVCWIVMAASGAINALIRVTPDQLLSTYGLLVLGKVIALLVLGVVGWLHRRGAVAAVVDRGDSAAILRLGGVEVLIMLATIGLAVALSHTAPPGGTSARPSRTEVLLGYDLNSMAMFSVHMGVHMLLSMLAPILLVLGGPVTLALRALPPAGAGSPPGPRTDAREARQPESVR